MSAAAVVAARRRPSVVLGVYLFETAFAWLLAAPWVETINKLWGAHPDGDRALYRPGLVELVDVSRFHGEVLRALTAATIVGLVTWLVLGLLPLGALLGGLSTDEPYGLRRAGERAGALFSRLALLQLLALVFYVLVVLLIGVAPQAVLSPRVALLDPRTALLVLSIPIVAMALVLAFLFATFDLARALVARHDRSAMQALGLAFRRPGASFALMMLSFPRLFASLGLLGWAALASNTISAVPLLFVVHQAVALARVALRASVLARAVRISDDVIATSP